MPKPKENSRAVTPYVRQKLSVDKQKIDQLPRDTHRLPDKQRVEGTDREEELPNTQEGNDPRRPENEATPTLSDRSKPIQIGHLYRLVKQVAHLPNVVLKHTGLSDSLFTRPTKVDCNFGKDSTWPRCESNNPIGQVDSFVYVVSDEHHRQ